MYPSSLKLFAYISVTILYIRHIHTKYNSVRLAIRVITFQDCLFKSKVVFKKKKKKKKLRLGHKGLLSWQQHWIRVAVVNQAR